MICPVCHVETDMSDYGWVQGHHIFVCKRCRNWLEEVKVLRTLPKKDKQLIQALEV